MADGEEPVVRNRAAITTMFGTFLVLVGLSMATLTSSLAIPGYLRVVKEGLTLATVRELILGFALPVAGCTSVVSGMGILALKNWARRLGLVIGGILAMLLLVTMAVGLVILILKKRSFYIWRVIILGLFCWSYAYMFLSFLRPSVKAQFQHH